jgi:hypothetical protein
MEIDYTNSYCLLSCCRLGDDLFMQIAKPHRDRTVFIGVKDGEEELRVLDGMQALVDMIDVGEDEDWSPETVHAAQKFTFNPEVDEWAKWKIEEDMEEDLEEEETE